MKGVFCIIILAMALYSCSSTSDNMDCTKSDIDTVKVSEVDTFILGNRLVHVERIDSAAFGSETNANIASTNSYSLNNGLVRKNGDSLVFLCEKRIAILVNDTSDSDRASRYDYIGYMPDIGKFLIHGAFYEWFSYLLIDRITADTTYVHSIPKVSPDKRTFVSGNADLLAELDFNGIEWHKNVNKPTLIGVRALSKWGPSEIKWVDNSTLLVEGFELDTSLIRERKVYLKLRIE